MCWVFLLHREQDFCNFCCKPSKIKFCIEGVSVGEICNTLQDSNEGDLSPHTSQTIYFSKTNENKRSDKEAPMGEVVELESGIEPLSIIFINIRRHSVLSCWRHQMETFSALLGICARNSPVTGEFPAQRPVTQSFDAFFDLRLNKRLSKQSWGWWLETPSRPLWRHHNALSDQRYTYRQKKDPCSGSEYVTYLRLDILREQYSCSFYDTGGKRSNERFFAYTICLS